MIRVTAVAQDRARALLQPADLAVDATAGKGIDTAMLAECVRPDGRVWACDVQEVALQHTRTLLETLGLAHLVRLVHDGHEHLPQWLPECAHGKLTLAMFNLGYLPTGDKTLTTRSDTTLRALDAAWQSLRPGGALSVVCYPGHEAGTTEAQSVEQWVETLDGAHVDAVKPTGTQRPSPFLLWIEKVR
ncbi:MAG: rRNA methylase [Puniceicoccaceae bacterium 5H]|nr:MAG: rRNA methylase [Puniceicoccaceae bacterium 5H]